MFLIDSVIERKMDWSCICSNGVVLVRGGKEGAKLEGEVDALFTAPSNVCSNLRLQYSHD